MAKEYYEQVYNHKGFKLQRFVTQQIEQCRADSLLNSCEQGGRGDRHRARLTCLRLPGAAAAQMTLPDPGFPGLVMNDKVYTDMQKFRNGLPPALNLHKCACNELLHEAMSNPAHAMSCRLTSGERTMRHDELKRLTTAQARRCGVPAKNEPSSDNFGAQRLRPDGYQRFALGPNLSDNVVCDPMAASYIKNHISGTPKLLDNAVRRKVNK